LLTAIPLAVPWLGKELAWVSMPALPVDTYYVAEAIVVGFSEAIGAVLWASMLSFSYAGLVEENPEFAQPIRQEGRQT
jgi:hypothetical protein